MGRGRTQKGRSAGGRVSQIGRCTNKVLTSSYHAQAHIQARTQHMRIYRHTHQAADKASNQGCPGLHHMGTSRDGHKAHQHTYKGEGVGRHERTPAQGRFNALPFAQACSNACLACACECLAPCQACATQEGLDHGLVTHSTRPMAARQLQDQAHVATTPPEHLNAPPIQSPMLLTHSCTYTRTHAAGILLMRAATRKHMPP